MPPERLNLPEGPKRTRTRRSSANSQTISLRSGGTITLSGMGINPFTMSADDLAYVTDLAHMLRAYSHSQAKTDPRKAAAEPPTPTREQYDAVMKAQKPS